jgi:hypothetical protein
VTSDRQRLAGRIQVDLPPAEAFRVFTPRGEELWAHGWQPRFPVPAADDSEPGTVFETHAHGKHATWLVTSREPGKRISYARVIPGEQAGTVTVTISASGGRTEAEVVYDLTALTSAASQELREFAGSYPAYLEFWQDAIAAWLDSQHLPHRREAG